MPKCNRKILPLSVPKRTHPFEEAEQAKRESRLAKGRAVSVKRKGRFRCHPLTCQFPFTPSSWSETFPPTDTRRSQLLFHDDGQKCRPKTHRLENSSPNKLLFTGRSTVEKHSSVKKEDIYIPCAPSFEKYRGGLCLQRPSKDKNVMNIMAQVVAIFN